VIVDSSALIAILRAEPEAEGFALAIEGAVTVRISAASYVEIGAVVDQARDPVVSRRVDDLLDVMGAIVEPVTAEQASIARAAYRDFGKGSGHAAGLNLGDCFSYALAKSSGEALLYKGRDFVHTDVTSVEFG
jgi:ribonuclease VapC